MTVLSDGNQLLLGGNPQARVLLLSTPSQRLVRCGWVVLRDTCLRYSLFPSAKEAVICTSDGWERI